MLSLFEFSLPGSYRAVTSLLKGMEVKATKYVEFLKILEARNTCIKFESIPCHKIQITYNLHN